MRTRRPLILDRLVAALFAAVAVTRGAFWQSAPYLTSAGVAATIGVGWWWVTRKRRLASARRRLGPCECCGDDLRATPERWPECGATARVPQRATARPTPTHPPLQRTGPAQRVSSFERQSAPARPLNGLTLCRFEGERTDRLGLKPRLRVEQRPKAERPALSAEVALKAVDQGALPYRRGVRSTSSRS